MLDTTAIRKGDIVCHRFTWRRYFVVSLERARALVLPEECREIPLLSRYQHLLWLDSRLLEVI